MSPKFSVIFVLILVSFFHLAKAQGQQEYWTIGPKIGYSFGEQGGLTAGIDLSYLPRSTSPILGFTADLTFEPHSVMSLHFGVEGALFVWVDIGPTLVLKKSTLYSGLSVILYTGIVAYPFYEFNILPGNSKENFQTLGAYVKFFTGKAPSFFN